LKRRKPRLSEAIKPRTQIPRLYCNVARLVSKRLQFCCWRHTFSDTCSQRPFVVLATAHGTFALPPRRNDGSSRVRGRALLSFRLVPGVRQRSLLSLQIETCAPFNSFPAWPVVPCVSPLALHTCPITVDRKLNLVPFASPSLDIFKNWTRAGTIEPSSPIILKSAPKRLRNLLDPLNRPLPICRDFYLPGVHLNDLAGLRAAIIASCTIRATQELRYRPDPLTFLVRG
jgi:hypothetical protein